jgi:hypothetical protein
MAAADSNPAISSADRDLMRRLAVVVVFLALFTAAASYLWRLYSTKFHATTGHANWIWAPHRIASNVPVVFFAARDFDLPPARSYARIKIFGDPEYTLYFNGQLIGGRRPGEDRHLDLFDVSELARDRRNRILVAVRSTNGVGGLIAGVDIGPELENLFFTGPDWKLFRTWSPELPRRDFGPASPPMLLGKPPTGRWDFLTVQPGVRARKPLRVVTPRRVESFRTEIPTIRIRQGVAVAGSEPVRATAYDFGPITGRIRITAPSRLPVPWVVQTRTANAPEELRMLVAPELPFVFAPGESAVEDADARSFRYVIVFGGRGRAEVVQEE